MRLINFTETEFRGFKAFLDRKIKWLEGLDILRELPGLNTANQKTALDGQKEAVMRAKALQKDLGGNRKTFPYLYEIKDEYTFDLMIGYAILEDAVPETLIRKAAQG